jgi:hypothetical protein
MVSGVQNWEVLMEEPCNDLQLGMVNLSELSCGLIFAYSPDELAYRHAGTGFMRSMQSGLPKYHKGSKVSFVLQLTEGSPYWYLEASVDGGKEACLCCGSGMMTNDGYLPAVRLQKPGKVRLLGIWSPA